MAAPKWCWALPNQSPPQQTRGPPNSGRASTTKQSPASWLNKLELLVLQRTSPSQWLPLWLILLELKGRVNRRTLDVQQPTQCCSHSTPKIHPRPTKTEALRANSRAGKAVGSLPIISLFAELLLKVAQGQGLGLQHPPVRDFFSTEKVSDNQLAGLERVDTCQFLWLFVTEKKTRCHKFSISKQIHTHNHIDGIYKGWGTLI